jgi:hypothetical protein
VHSPFAWGWRRGRPAQDVAAFVAIGHDGGNKNTQGSGDMRKAGLYATGLVILFGVLPSAQGKAAERMLNQQCKVVLTTTFVRPPSESNIPPMKPEHIFQGVNCTEQSTCEENMRNVRNFEGHGVYPDGTTWDRRATGCL